MASNQPTSTGASNTGMRSEIQVRWGKFSSQEIAALKDTSWWPRFKPSTRWIRRRPKRTSTRSPRVGSSDH